MSVTASAPRPLLFGDRSPSPPTFSSSPPPPNPQSPIGLHHHDAVTSPSSSLLQDVDMSSSVTMPPPTGQNHDREEDAFMHDPDGLANGHIETDIPGPHDLDPSPPSVAVEEVPVGVDEDAMDTTPDNTHDPGLSNNSADPQEAAQVASPAPNGIALGDEPVPPPTDDPTPAVGVPPVDPPPPVDPSAQPPPPPPEPIRSESDSSDDDDGQQPWHPIQEDTSTPDEAELKEIESTDEFSALDHEHWEKKAYIPLDDPEYTAGPSGRINWAIEHYNGTRESPNRELVMKSEPVNIGGYEWQIKFYPKGNDSDYLSVYVECLSVSDKKDKDESFESLDPSNQETEKQEEDSKEASLTAASNDESAPISTGNKSETTLTNQDCDSQHAPLPLLQSKSFPSRKSVAAQVSVVLYNPSEPRVNYSRTCLHRFCSGSPDWGWTRFHGPYYDISHRMRGQRQALLRNDKLAFTGYIRVVQDETNCLWEHSSSDNPWDSFAMTGLQSLMLGEATPVPSGGNMISTIASWMLFSPFRQFLYTIKVPDPELEPFVKPKPLIGALQKVLYLLRTQVRPRAGPVTLDDVLDALEWYGIHDRLDKLDVLEIWEILRVKIEKELEDTSQPKILDELFGPKKDHTLGVPSYRVPVLGVESVQQAINTAIDLTHPSHPMPQLLTLELDRQDFDLATRSYVKVISKIALDEHIIIRQTAYTLYGIIVHKQTLQSYIYNPILRPEGPGSKWYAYTDGKEENIVKSLTKRQAIDAHEGKAGTGKLTGNDSVAYIVMYVRDDVAREAFEPQAEKEDWQVPSWIPQGLEKDTERLLPHSALTAPTLDAPSETSKESGLEKETDGDQVREFQVISSETFLQHEGPGTFDAYDVNWKPGDQTFVQLKPTDGGREIREKLAATVKDIEDSRQIKFWFLDTIQGSYSRPNLLGTGEIEYSSGSTDRYADPTKEWKIQNSPHYWMTSRIWIHVIDFESLTPPTAETSTQMTSPEQTQSETPSHARASDPAPDPAPDPALDHAIAPEPGNTMEDAQTISEASTSTMIPPTEHTSASATEAIFAPVTTSQPEDTPMSEPNDPDLLQAELPPSEDQPPVSSTPTDGLAPTPAEMQSTDTAMVELEVEVAVEGNAVNEPPIVDVVLPSTAAHADTEMGGTQEELIPPPPPPPPPPIEEEATESAPPQIPESTVREHVPEPPPDEIYFFLKFFDLEAQRLVSRGSHIALRSSKVDGTVLKVLGEPADKEIELFEEEDLTTTRPLRLRRSFSSNDLHNTAVVIFTFPVKDEQRDKLAARAAFTDIKSFLAFRALSRNFPGKLNGYFTYHRFSSQYYKGEIKNGHRHGHGTRIYHTGATYEGSFRLGQRHGHGLYTFQNGDTYDGDWVANQQHGNGTFVEATSGNTYVGGWKNDKKFGEGVTHWKNAQETERLCRICWDESADAAFYDCGHVVACLECARQVQNCPVCRKRVVSAMKLYYVA